MSQSAWSVLLPWPPSVNHIWKCASGRFYKTRHYVQWLKTSMALIAEAGRPALRPPIACHIVIYPASGTHWRRDADNFCKPVLDVLRQSGALPDDNLRILPYLVVSTGEWESSPTIGSGQSDGKPKDAGTTSGCIRVILRTLSP